MKLFKALFIALIFVGVAACNSDGYKPEQCAELMAKIRDNEKLSKDECVTLMDQSEIIFQSLEKKWENAKGNEKKELALQTDERNQEMVSYMTVFILYLESNYKELPASIQKRLDALKKEMSSPIH